MKFVQTLNSNADKNNVGEAKVPFTRFGAGLGRLARGTVITASAFYLAAIPSEAMGFGQAKSSAGSEKSRVEPVKSEIPVIDFGKPQPKNDSGVIRPDTLYLVKGERVKLVFDVGRYDTVDLQICNTDSIGIFPLINEHLPPGPSIQTFNPWAVPILSEGKKYLLRLAIGNAPPMFREIYFGTSIQPMENIEFDR